MVETRTQRLERLNGGQPVEVRMVDPGDEVVWSEVWRDDCYRFDEPTVGNRVLVDVGANIGFATLRAASYGAAGVIAVEPDAYNFRRLQENVAENRLRDRVRTLQAAVGGPSHAERAAVMRDGHELNYGGCWTTPYAETEWADDQAVPVVDLAGLVDLVDERVELVLKVDTEGAEYEILGDDVDPGVLRRFAVIVGEFHHFPRRGVGGRDRVGALVTKLLDTHTVEVLGRPEDGGLFWCRRYAG